MGDRSYTAIKQLKMGDDRKSTGNNFPLKNTAKNGWRQEIKGTKCSLENYR